MNFEKIDFEKEKFEKQEAEQGGLIECSYALESDTLQKIKSEKSETKRNKMMRKLAVWSVITMLSLGGAGELKAQEKEIPSLKNKMEQTDENKERLEKLLRKNEYLVPDNILNIYYQTIDVNAINITNVSGGYIDRNWLSREGKTDEFGEKLKKLGLDEEEADGFLSLFSSKDVIILNDSLLRDEKKFKEILFHERIHEEMSHLNKEDLDSLKAGYNDVENHPAIPVNPDSNFGVSERSFLEDKFDTENTNSHGWFSAIASFNWKEFYPYLANGKFVPRVLEEIRKNHPGAYKIFEKMESEAKVEKQ